MAIFQKRQHFRFRNKLKMSWFLVRAADTRKARELPESHGALKKLLMLASVI
jgi:hypothetical protein